jgi:hypothetical protein
MGKCSNMNIMRYGVNVNETTTPKSNCIRNAFLMSIPEKFGFNCSSGFSKEVF